MTTTGFTRENSARPCRLCGLEKCKETTAMVVNVGLVGRPGAKVRAKLGAQSCRALVDRGVQRRERWRACRALMEVYQLVITHSSAEWPSLS